MKSFVLFFIIATSIANAQNIEASKVPHAVLNNFVKRFGRPMKTQWLKYKIKEADTYDASFDLNDKRMECRFSNIGTWMKTDEISELSAFPDSVQQVIEKEYYQNSEYKIISYDKVDTPKLKSLFEVEISKGKNEWELLYDASGKLVDKVQRK